MYLVSIYAALLMALFACSERVGRAQSSIGSMAEYKKKQDDGMAQTVRESQARAKAGKLAMMNPGGKPGSGQTGASRPAVIKLANRPRITGVDNRHAINVR